MTQPNFQALQSKVQVPLSPGYAFSCEESRVSAPRISQQASVKCPVRENTEMLNDTALMNAFVPSDDLTPLRQNRYSYLWMGRRFPHYFHLLHEQQQQQQQFNAKHFYFSKQVEGKIIIRFFDSCFQKSVGSLGPVGSLGSVGSLGPVGSLGSVGPLGLV